MFSEHQSGVSKSLMTITLIDSSKGQ